MKILDAVFCLNHKWQRQAYWQRLKGFFRAAIMDREVAGTGGSVAVRENHLS